MIIKDLVVTGLVKLLRHAKIDTLIVEKINEVTKEEIDTLKGIDSNIQEQLTAISNTVNAANTEQTTFKTGIANAVNNIPRNPNSSPLTSSSGLSQFVSELGEIEHGPDVSGVSATADTVLSGYKFVDSDWDEVTGNIPIHESGNISWWAGFETTGLQQGGRPEIDDQCVVSIPMTQDYIGYYKKDSVVQGNIYLPKNKIAHGVRVGRFRNADDSNSIVGTYDSDGTITAGDILNGAVGYSKGRRIVGNIPIAPNAHMPSWQIESMYWYEFNGIANGCFDRWLYLNSPLYIPKGIKVLVRTEIPQNKIAYGYKVYNTLTGSFTGDGDITAANVLLGKIGYSKGQKVVGTMKNHADYTPFGNNRIVYNGEYNALYIGVDPGAYLTPTVSGVPEIYVPQASVANAIGLTADKIVQGNTILGVNGGANALVFNDCGQIITANNQYDYVFISASTDHSSTSNSSDLSWCELVGTYIGRSCYSVGISVKLNYFRASNGTDYTSKVSLQLGTPYKIDEIRSLRSDWNEHLLVRAIKIKYDFLDYDVYTLSFTITVHRSYYKSDAEDGISDTEYVTCENIRYIID